MNTGSRPVRRQDWFYYDSADMRFHSFVKKDLCITFRNPTRINEHMVLDKCPCNGGATQEILIKYYVFGDNNGFEPWTVFSFRNVQQPNMAIKISNDGSLLLPSQRYAKISFGAKNRDDELFYWDPIKKCLKNYLYNLGCIGQTAQGSTNQMIALGESQNVGRVPGDFAFDGTFLWINGLVAQAQGGYMNTNNVHVSLNQITGQPAQMWTMKFTNIKANKQPSKQKPAATSSNWGWDTNGFFEIRSFNGQVVYINGNTVGLRNRANNADEQFFFDRNTKTIVSRRNRKVSLAVKEVSNGHYRLVARNT